MTGFFTCMMLDSISYRHEPLRRAERQMIITSLYYIFTFTADIGLRYTFNDGQARH